MLLTNILIHEHVPIAPRFGRCALIHYGNMFVNSLWEHVAHEHFTIVNYFAIVKGHFVTVLLVNCGGADTLRTRACHTRRAFLRGRAAADPAGLGRGAQLVKVAKVKAEVEQPWAVKSF